MEINILTSGYHFTIPHNLKFKPWINKVSKEEGYSIENISIILTTRKNIVTINKKFLKHNYPTDIITFDYSSEKKLSGELFICIPVVRENALFFNVPFDEEFTRVVFHGLLHLMKYNDHSSIDIKQMRFKENYYLKKFFNR